MDPEPGTRAQSKDSAPRPREPPPNQVQINRRIHAEFLDIEQHIAWHSGRRVDQVIFRATDDGWMCIVKAWKGHTAWAAFLYAPSLQDCAEIAGYFASKGQLTWNKDKYPSKRVKAWREGI